MAADINNSPHRFDYARAERDDENNPADPAATEAQTPAQSEPEVATPTEQQGQSSGDGSSAGNDAGTHDPATPPPAPEDTTPLPAHFRYVLAKSAWVARITRALLSNKRTVQSQIQVL